MVHAVAAYQVIGLVLVHLGNGLMVLGGHGEPSHVRIDLDCLQQAIDGFLCVRFLEAVRCVDVIGGRIMAAASLRMQIGRFAEGTASLRPLLGHFEQIGSACIALDSFIGAICAITATKIQFKCMSIDHYNERIFRSCVMSVEVRENIDLFDTAAQGQGK